MKDITDECWWNVEEIFAQALDLPPEEREAFLDEACGDDLYLRQQVKILLATQKEAESFLENPADWFDAPPLPSLSSLPAQTEQVTPFEGQRIGPYRLLRGIGRGGMGQVYLARREDQAFKQYVALKLIRRGLDTEDILRRFRNERQILAALNHPNIARLLDGGATEEGVSYFVMEYVEGLPITRYCDTQRLSIDARLALFRQVCEAVQYAHQNLIVHRDLKPSNILVTADGVPKLLDFGIAKLLNPNLSGYSVPMTRTELRVMTPEYASPEQVRGETITTASDVYALGVLLYELLSGRRPYRFKSSLAHKIEQVICEQEPEKPSTAVTSIEQVQSAVSTSETLTPEAVSAARATAVERLRRHLRGDLDNIVLKALKKEPLRRYGSAEQLSEDLGRYQKGLPVRARRETVGYRVKKFVHRHKVVVAAAATIAVLLVSVAVLATVFAVTTARQNAQIAEENDKFEEVVGFVEEVFKMSDPEQALGEKITARELLDAGAERIEEELADRPEVQAKMMSVMSGVYRSLGLFEPSEHLAREALQVRIAHHGREHPDVAESMNDLGNVLRERGRYGEAEPLHREALALRRSVLGEAHLDVAESTNDLGNVLRVTGNYDEADSLLREALALRRRVLGETHPDVAQTLNILAIVLARTGDYKAAEPLFREALAIRRKLLGEEHPAVSSSLNNLAGVLQDQGNYAEAEALHREVLAIRRKVLGEEHPDVTQSLSNLALILQNQGNYAEAETLFREALEMRRKVLGEEHPDVARSLNNLAEVLQDQGNYAEAETLFRQALEMRRKLLGQEHPDVARSLSSLGWLLIDKGDAQLAEPVLRQALAMRRKLLGQDDWYTVFTQGGLGACLTLLARYDEAEPLLVQAYALLDDKIGSTNYYTRRVLERVVSLYEAWGKPDEAAAYRARFSEQP